MSELPSTYSTVYYTAKTNTPFLPHAVAFGKLLKSVHNFVVLYTLEITVSVETCNPTNLHGVNKVVATVIQVLTHNVSDLNARCSKGLKY